MAEKTDDLIISISTDLASVRRALKRLEADVAASSKGIEKQFASVGKGIDKAMPTGVQQRIEKMVGIQVAATKEWTGALADQGKEMERVRARFNPMFATITKYRSAVGEIRAAHRLGAISADEMAAAMSRERQAALASIATIKQRNAALADTPNVGTLNPTSNLAAQGFDIATTAAFMPWYAVALQQGPQVAQVFNDIRASGQRIGPAVAGAFAQILNPVSLVTIGVIGLTAAAVQYFTAAEDGAEATEKALREQEQLIQRVAQAWGDVLPAIRAVAAERERLAGKVDIEEATQQRIAEVFKGIGQEVTSAGDQVTDLMDVLRNMAPPEQLVAWQNALRAITTSAAENKTTVEEMRAAQQAALDLYASTGIPVFQETANAIGAMIPQLQEARAEIAGLAEAQTTANAVNDLQAAINNISSTKARGELDDLLKKAREGEISIKDLLAELARISGYAPDVSGIIGAFRAVAEAAAAARAASSGFTGKESQGGRTRYGGTGFMRLPDEVDVTPTRRVDPYFLPPERTGGGGGGRNRRTADDRFFEDIEAIRQRTIALAEERAQLSLSYEAQQRRKTAFDLEQKALKDVREAARRKGDQDWQNAQLAPEQLRQIDEVSAAYARQAAELKKAQEQRAFAEDALYGLFTDLVPAIETGNKALDSFLNKLIEVGLQAALLGTGPFGGGGGGLIGALLGGILPGFASGTANTGGRRGQPIGVVHGQEAVIPLPGSGKVPVQIQTPKAPRFASASAPDSTSITYAPVINAPGADAAALARVEQSVRELGRNVPKMAVSAVKTTQNRKTRP